ncbi:right-handed parallel beta-helix repeat-containing protein, partial [Ruegeria sp. HKCCE4150]
MSTTITVTSAAELNQALSQATGGETILLAAGNYGKLSLKNAQYASNVTLKSADPNALASFSEVYLTNSSNITFDEIKFDYTFSQGDANHTTKFLISSSNNITIDNSVFDGDFASGTGTNADGTGFGKGLVIRDSSSIDVINTEFHSWWKALGASRSTDINFSGNNIHTIRSDGISLGEVQNVLIENNYIHDFGGAAGSGDHRDMIQIQRSNGTGSSDITIRNNILDMGTGDYTQGIWAGQDKASYSDAADWNYNIVIENNVLYNAHANGIAVHMTNGLTIDSNTLITVPSQQTGGVATPKIIVGGSSKNVTVEQNVTPSVVGYTGQSDWIVQDNAIIQNRDPSLPDHYDFMFTYIATAAIDGYNQYGVIPGSKVDLLDAGSSLVDLYPLDYDSWVGSSSTTVVNPGGSGTNNTGTTSPDSGTSTPTAPDSGTSTPTAPD